MKKLITLAILLLVAMPLALAKQSEKQMQINERVNDFLQTASDYEALIEVDNKVETVCEELGIEYDSAFDKEMRMIFRAIYNSDGFRSFLRPRLGRHFAGSRRGGAAPTPVITALCGNGIIESPEECDVGEDVEGDGCTYTCTIVAAL